MSIATGPGSPFPLGARCDAGGINFAIFAPDAHALALRLYEHAQATVPIARLELDARLHRSGDYWHVLRGGGRRRHLLQLGARGAGAPRSLRARDLDAAVEPRAGAGRRAGRDARARRRRGRLRLGRRHAAAAPARARDHLRIARGRLHAPSLRRGAGARHLCGIDRKDSLLARARCHPCRAAAGDGLRRTGRAGGHGGAGSAQLLGLQSLRLLRAARGLRQRAGAGARGAARSREGAASCRARRHPRRRPEPYGRRRRRRSRHARQGPGRAPLLPRSTRAAPTATTAARATP